MKHKLQDIQHNKQYLEKKIHEYERKLNELKGGSNPDTRLNQNSSGAFANKLNTLSTAILEKVLKQ